MAIGDITTRAVKRKDGTTYEIYQGEYRDRDGQRRFVSDRNKHKAQSKLRAAMADVDSGTHAKGKETLGQAFEEYLYSLERRHRSGDCSQAHLKNDRYNFSLLSAKLKNEKLSAFKDSGLIKEELDRLRDTGRFGIRARISLRDALSRVFTFAMESPRGYIPRNVLRDFPIKLPKPPKRTNDASVEVATAVLRAARQALNDRGSTLLVDLNVYAVLCLIMQTGLRPSEAFGLRVPDIALRPEGSDVWGEATIRNTCVSEGGFQQRTKNEEIRKLPLLGTLFGEAWSMVERFHQAYRWAEGPGHRSYDRAAIAARALRYFDRRDVPLERRTSGFLFVNVNGNPYTARTFYPHVRDVVLRAGFAKRDAEERIIIGSDGKAAGEFTLYSFRHMVATFNAYRLPPHVAASITGHNVQTYLGTYVHGSQGDHIAVAQSLSELEGALTPTGALTDIRERGRHTRPDDKGPWQAVGLSRTEYYRRRKLNPPCATDMQQRLLTNGKKPL